MKRLISFFLLIPSILFAQIHNTKSKYYVDTQDTATSNAINNSINVKTWGAKGNGITDDKTAIQTALNACYSGSTLLFPAGTYAVSGAINIPAGLQNFTIQGYGATILSTMADPGATSPIPPSATTATILTNSFTGILSGVTPTANIVYGDLTLSLASTVGVQAGDILYVATTKTYGGYQVGFLRLIKSVASNTVTVDVAFDHALAIVANSVTATIVRPLNNFTMRGVTFQLPSGYHQAVAQMAYMTNVRIEDCNFMGGGENYLGLVLANTIQGRVQNCYFYEFQDNNLSYGYGVAVSGGNISVSECTFIRNKHGFTCGSNLYTSKDLWCTRCYAVDPQVAAIEAHGSCERVHILDNNVVDVGRTWTSTGIWLRGKNGEIRGNNIYACPGNPNNAAGISLIEVADSNEIIAFNKVDGCQYGVHIQTDSTSSDISIDHNRITNIQGFGILSEPVVHNLSIQNNFITTVGYGIQTYGGEHPQIIHNVIFGLTGFIGYSLILGNVDPATPTYNTALISENIFKNVPSNAGSLVRLTNLYRKVSVINNQYDTGDTVSTWLYLYGNSAQKQLVQYGNINIRKTVADSSITIIGGIATTTGASIGGSLAIPTAVAIPPIPSSGGRFIVRTGSTVDTLYWVQKNGALKQIAP